MPLLLLLLSIKLLLLVLLLSPDRLPSMLPLLLVPLPLPLLVLPRLLLPLPPLRPLLLQLVPSPPLTRQLLYLLLHRNARPRPKQGAPQETRHKLHDLPAMARLLRDAVAALMLQHTPVKQCKCKKSKCKMCKCKHRLRFQGLRCTAWV